MILRANRQLGRDIITIQYLHVGNINSHPTRPRASQLSNAMLPDYISIGL